MPVDCVQTVAGPAMVTTGSMQLVVKVWSSPYDVPAALIPTHLKWYNELINSPETAAETGEVVMPFIVAGVALMVLPYVAVRPYSKVTAVEAQLAVTIPFRLAELAVILVARVVTTLARMGAVVKVISFPLVNPPTLAPFTLK